MLIEGRISIDEGEANRLIEPGGYAYLPALGPENDLLVTNTLFVLRVLGRPVKGAVASPNFCGLTKVGTI